MWTVAAFPDNAVSKPVTSLVGWVWLEGGNVAGLFSTELQSTVEVPEAFATA